MIEYTKEQQAQLGQPLASESQLIDGMQVYHRPGPYEMTLDYHRAMKMPIGDVRETPSVSLRLLRGQLILEEFLELLEAMGLQLFAEDGCVDSFTIEHIEGSRYNAVETADALGDLNVVVNGSAVAFGIYMPDVDHEIFCSNMTKLGVDGEPIINQCLRAGDGTHDCDLSPEQCEPEHKGKPIGKQIKGPNFVPANIARIIHEQEKKS